MTDPNSGAGWYEWALQASALDLLDRMIDPSAVSA